MGIDEIKDNINSGISKVLGQPVGGVDMKHILLITLAAELEELARKDIKKGKLHPEQPYILKSNADRLIKAWRANKITSKALVRFKITDNELVDMMKGVLDKLGFKEIVEEPTLTDSTTAK
jgi:hypothetical protein